MCMCLYAFLAKVWCRVGPLTICMLCMYIACVCVYMLSELNSMIGQGPMTGWGPLYDYLYVWYVVFGGLTKLCAYNFVYVFRDLRFKREGPDLIATHTPVFSAICDFGILTMIIVLFWNSSRCWIKGNEYFGHNKNKIFTHDFWDVTHANFLLLLVLTRRWYALLSEGNGSMLRIWVLKAPYSSLSPIRKLYKCSLSHSSMIYFMMLQVQPWHEHEGDGVIDCT